MIKIGIPCEDDQKVIAFIQSMYACKFFTDLEMIIWENSSDFARKWTPTTKLFSKLWADRIAFTKREDGTRLYESAAKIRES